MLPLVEMILKSQNGDAFSQIQQQFGLDAKQAEKAIEAVMPAFSTGLKRNASSPQDFGAFMQALSDGRHEKFADDQQAAFSDEGITEGKGILGHLFGSKETSRAVATQAAQASGVGESVIKKMLPIVASMVMGGLFKQSSTQQPDSQIQQVSASNLSGGGILGQILGELAKGGLNSPGSRQGRRQTPSRGNNPLGDILEQMMGGQNRTNTSRNDPSGDNNPLGQIFEEMLSGKRGGYEAPEREHLEKRGRSRKRNDDYRDEGLRRGGDDAFRDRFQPDGGFEDIGSAEQYSERERNYEPESYRPERSNRKNDRAQRPQGGLEDLFGDMFETGRKVDRGYQGDIESIFDKFMKR